MKARRQLRRHGATGLVLLAVASLGAASERLDFSGKYSARKDKTSSAALTLLVVQDDKKIQITRTDNGKTALSEFPLDGSKGVYRSPSGVTGEGKAHFEGQDLVLDCMALTRPDPNDPPMRFHVKQHWHLSSDLRILTIQMNFEYPDSTGLNKFPAFGRIETYLRTEHP